MGDMFGFIWDTLMDWPVGTILGAILLIAVLGAVVLLAILVVAGIYHLVDYTGMPVSSRVAKVTGKSYKPAHTEYILMYNAATKTSMPTPIFHPACWTLVVDLGFDTDSIDVSSDFYDQVGVGKPVVARYKMGRISRSLNVTGVSLPR